MRVLKTWKVKWEPKESVISERSLSAASQSCLLVSNLRMML